MIKGIYAPIPTPFVNDEIDFMSLQQNLVKWGKSALEGLVVLGSNGEFAYLSYAEKVEMLQFVYDHWPRSKRLIAGTGCESTKETLALTHKAAKVGYDVALVITPHFYKGSMTDVALEAYFSQIADQSPIPIMLYNMPRNTGLNISSKLAIKLALHPNIAGIKDSSGNIVQISEICAHTANDFSVFAGSGSFLLPAYAVGAVGGTLAVANIMPETCVALADAFNAGNIEEARFLQQLLLAPNAAVTTLFGIAGLKYALQLLGYHGGPVRAPMLPLDKEQKEKVEDILKTAGKL